MTIDLIRNHRMKYLKYLRHGEIQIHRGRDEIAELFFFKKLYITWNLFPSVQLTKSSIGSDNGLAPYRRKPLNEAMIVYFIHAHSASMG